MSEISPEQAYLMQRKIAEMNAALDARNCSEFTARIETAHRVAGVTYAAPDAARLLIAQAAIQAPSDPEASAAALVRAHPQIFREKPEVRAATTEQRIQELTRAGVLQAPKPTREQFIAEAQAGADPSTATPAQREAHLRAKGIL